MSHSAPSLTDQLGETVDTFIASLPDDDAMAVGASFEKLQASHTGESAITVGDNCPRLHPASGNRHSSDACSTNSTQGPWY